VSDQITNNMYVKHKDNDYPYKNITVLSGDIFGTGVVIFTTVSNAGRTRKVKCLAEDLVIEEEIEETPAKENNKENNPDEA